MRGTRVPLLSRAFSHARGHFRVSRVLLDGPRKRNTARNLARSWNSKLEQGHFKYVLKVLGISSSLHLRLNTKFLIVLSIVKFASG